MSEQFELGSLRLAQAKALTEILGMAVTHGDGEELPAIDAASGIIELMNQAYTAFLADARGGKDRVSADDMEITLPQ